MELSSQFSPHELRDIIIAWVVLSLAWGLSFLLGILSGTDAAINAEYLAAIMIATVTGFILHELGHKFVAMRYGYLAHFRLWILGLMLAVFTAIASTTVGFPVLFGAPGAVYIVPAAAGYYGSGYYSSSYRPSNTNAENLRISLAGPGLNLLFGVVFFLVFLSTSNAFLELVAAYGFGINVGLGAFNMLPIPPLDGSKVFKESLPIGLAIAVPLWVGALFLLLNII
ncbi:MAG: site-2 protease family protein [Nitrososphaerales archaeon]